MSTNVHHAVRSCISLLYSVVFKWANPRRVFSFGWICQDFIFLLAARLVCQWVARGVLGVWIINMKIWDVKQETTLISFSHVLLRKHHLAFRVSESRTNFFWVSQFSLDFYRVKGNVSPRFSTSAYLREFFDRTTPLNNYGPLRSFN